MGSWQSQQEGAGRYTDKAFTFAGTFALSERLDRRFSTLIDLNAQMAAGGTKRSAEGTLALKGRLALNAGSFDGLDATVELRLPALGGVAVGAIASTAGLD